MRIEMARLPIVVGLMAWCAVFTSEPAKADVITTFDIAGEIGLPFQLMTPSFPISGSVTIDTTLGIVIAQTIIQGSVTISQAYNAQAQSFFVDIVPVVLVPPDPSCLGCYPAEDLIYFNTASLVGYAGGALGSFTNRTAGGDASFFSGGGVDALLLTGTATPEAIPEPVSIALLTAGVAATLIPALRRKPRG